MLGIDIGPVVGNATIELTELVIDDANVVDMALIPSATSPKLELDPLIVASTLTDPALKATLTSRAATPLISEAILAATICLISFLFLVTRGIVVHTLNGKGHLNDLHCWCGCGYFAAVRFSATSYQLARLAREKLRATWAPDRRARVTSVTSRTEGEGTDHMSKVDCWSVRI